MTVDVDDCKLGGPVSAVKSVQKRIAEVVAIEPPTPMKRYLRCSQRKFESNIDRSVAPGNKLPGIPKAAKPNERSIAKVMEYDLSPFIRQRLEACEALPGGGLHAG